MTKMNENEIAMESSQKSENLVYGLIQSTSIGLLLTLIAYAALNQTMYSSGSLPYNIVMGLLLFLILASSAIFVYFKPRVDGDTYQTSTYLKTAGLAAALGILVAVSYFNTIDFSRAQQEKLKAEELATAKEQIAALAAGDKVSLREAEEFMKTRCTSVNQHLLESKLVFFDGVKTYAFLSVASNGYHCISMVSPHKLEVLASNCGPMQTKVTEWSALR